MMGSKKVISLWLLIILIGMGSHARSMSSKEVACVAIICLSGDGGSACSPALDKFFAIEKFTGGLTGAFSKKLTKMARKKFLRRCDAPNVSEAINRAMAQHGATRKRSSTPLNPTFRDEICNSGVTGAREQCK